MIDEKNFERIVVKRLKKIGAYDERIVSVHRMAIREYNELVAIREENPERVDSFNDPTWPNESEPARIGAVKRFAGLPSIELVAV